MLVYEKAPIVQELKVEAKKSVAMQSQKCVPCEGIGRKMTIDEIQANLQQVDGWNVVVEDTVEKIERVFSFRDFKQALLFINTVGEIAEQNGHHPDIILFRYNNVKIQLYTHALQGVSFNDFIIAAKIDTVSL